VLGVLSQTLTGNPHLPNRTQDSFISVVVTVVHVQTCCLALIHDKRIKFMCMAQSGRAVVISGGNTIGPGNRHFFSWKKNSDGSEDAYCKLRHSTTSISRHSNLLNHKKNKNVTEQTDLKVVKTSSSKNDALKVAELQIPVSIAW